LRYQRNLYIAEKYIKWATILSLKVPGIYSFNVDIYLAVTASKTREKSGNFK